MGRGDIRGGRLDTGRFTHVGKKLTKLRPNSCEQPMTANKGTFGSLIACIKPANALVEGFQYYNERKTRALHVRILSDILICFTCILSKTDLRETSLSRSQPTSIVRLQWH